MPRGAIPTRVLPKLSSLQQRPTVKVFRKPKKSNEQVAADEKDSGIIYRRGAPLFNAKRIIEGSGAASTQSIRKLKADPFDQSWRKDVSEDVLQFVDDMEVQGTKLLPEELLQLIRDPAKYFSRPQHVPECLRQQVYFPNFSVCIKRNKHLSPYYAQFQVPLWFNKLDLKAYLKDLYNVDTVHIRSWVTHVRPVRQDALNKFSLAAYKQSPAKKEMIAQLVDPFVWPVAPEDIDRTPFSTQQFQDVAKVQEDESKKTSDLFNSMLDRKHRKSIATQAQEMLQGKIAWGPTWQQLAETRRAMAGAADTLPPSHSPPPPPPPAPKRIQESGVSR